MNPIILVINYALTAIFPNLSQLWATNKIKFNQYLSNGFKYFMIIALILCFTFTLFAKEIIVILFTEDYLPAVQVCQVQIWFIFFMSINSFIGTIWGAIDKERLLVRTTIINSLISTPALFIGSYFGAIGLALSYVISFAIFEVYIWFEFRKSGISKIKGELSFWILSTALMIISAIFIQFDFPLFLKILIDAFFVIILVLYIIRSIRQLKLT
jgi:O-antigen/teichoic acid export membrane protein